MNNITRRSLLRFAAFAPFGVAAGAAPFASQRPPIAARKFASSAVEAAIAKVKNGIGDPELAWMFENCYPNTLDTTVEYRIAGDIPDTFVITGDINAMWLRDSSAQVWPYLRFASEDARLQSLIEGVVRRQAQCILLDPYANAFQPNPRSAPLKWAVHDRTTMKPGVGERKWEIDSLCYPVRLAHGYWKATGNSKPFDSGWRQAAWQIVKTFREQQRKAGPGPYHFQREAEAPTETLALNGYGNPARPVGLIHSGFRPSDDACIYPLFIPANLFASVSLGQLAEMAQEVLHDAALAAECQQLGAEVQSALERYGRMRDPEFGETWAYEVDGYGNQLFMDDANAPGLLSLAYLGCCDKDDALYKRTRARALSSSNPYYFEGRAAKGIGGPHEGLNMIWPMSIIVRALTSTDGQEILQCLSWLKATHAGTGFMHESFEKDNPAKFTRAWFAWANTLFGELIISLSDTNPGLLRRAIV
jgi:uncharacterized protein